MTFFSRIIALFALFNRTSALFTLFASLAMFSCTSKWECVDLDGDGQCVSEGDCCEASEPGELCPLGAGTALSEDVYTGAPDPWYDGVDQDCGGNSDYDQDGDGYDSTEYGGTDCNDTNSVYNPSAEETDCTDPIDYNCDGSVMYDDVDGDGIPACEDCDDTDSSVNTVEGYYLDRDGDGYGDGDSPATSCEELLSSVQDPNDCNDADPYTNPAAEEICDDVDNDCNEDLQDDDWDKDGLMCYNDCDDTDATINTDAEEVWYDGIDQNCGDDSDYDQDGDGYDSTEYGGNDCNDTERKINIEGAEICDGVDNDCNGVTDGSDAIDTISYYLDSDGDGYGDASNLESACEGAESSDYILNNDDCNDTSALINPASSEICDSVDNDCDGSIDEDGICDTGTPDTGTPVDTGGDTASGGDSGGKDTSGGTDTGIVDSGGDTAVVDTGVPHGTFASFTFGDGTGTCAATPWTNGAGSSIPSSMVFSDGAGTCGVYIYGGGSLTGPSPSTDELLYAGTGFTVGTEYTAEMTLTNTLPTDMEVYGTFGSSGITSATVSASSTGILSISWTANSSSADLEVWSTGTDYDIVLHDATITY